MITALYGERSDGDYDLVATVDENYPELVELVRDVVEKSGELVRVESFGEAADCPTILEAATLGKTAPATPIGRPPASTPLMPGKLWAVLI